MENNKVLTVIRFLIKGYKTEYDENGVHYEKVLKDDFNGETLYLWNCRYLLNQVVRQYNVPKERYFYSEKAEELFNNLGEQKDKDGKILHLQDCYYKEGMVCQNDGVRCPLYSGSHSKPWNEKENCVITKSQAFSFNDAFTLEHIIPVSKIIDQLLELDPDNCSDKEIYDILEQICIARITKEEDRGLHNRNKREGGFNEIYKKIYCGCEEPIILKDCNGNEVKKD